MKMKPNHYTINLVMRLGLSLVLAIFLMATVSCGNSDSDSWLSFGEKETLTEAAFRSLESKFEDLHAQVTGESGTSWQAIAAFFIVLSGFALVFGAALGSQARKVSVSDADAATTLESQS